MQTTFKLFFLFLICLSLTLLSGCGGGGSTATDSGSESTTSGAGDEHAASDSEGESIANSSDVPIAEPAPSVKQPSQDAPAIPPQVSYQAPGRHIFEAARWGTVRDIEQHINNGADINTPQHGTGSTPLHDAITNPYFGVEIVRYLISKGADVNVHASGGNTPLHVAAINPHADAEILRLLIANGANANAKNGAGKTPLDFTAMNRNKSMIEEKQSIISAAMKQ